MEAVGGYDSPAGGIVWHVVGGGLSLRQRALRQRWGVRPVRPDQARGVLVAALSVLVAVPARHGSIASAGDGNTPPVVLSVAG